MKLVKLTYAPPLKSEESHWNLLLENMSDVTMYIEAAGPKFAESAIEFWDLAKKHGDKVDHYTDRENGVHQLGQIKYYTHFKELSIVDYCNHMDTILEGKFKNISAIVMNGKSIRMNSAGGYSPMSDMFQVIESRECDKHQLLNFLSSGINSLKKPKLEIKRPWLIIENSHATSDELFRFSRDLTRNEFIPDYILNFESETVLYDYDDFYKLFSDGLKNGWHTLIVETTLIKRHQFEKVKKIIEKVMEDNSDKSLIVYILKNGDFNDIVTDVSNIHIVNKSSVDYMI